ncbi:uncharacterized protein N7500_010158 [Penicillium coprophilum]|uniref:uncharacterized protein n=1 Tax=Penicillium coprophilum TaxID=36646 RepID=UPI002382F1CB|nr:uncharacterized protein N7500_010158 [Penicillium coprophilum]KAJ5154719.1 hypothetical protein N7500_010158 [Penicillium coprophilum]
MDEKLALQIWHLVSSNQASGRLRNLRVMPFGHDQLPKYEHWLVDWFSRSFLITRYNFHNVGVPTVSEIGKREREIRNQLLFQEIDGIYVSEELQQVLSDLWPSESGYTEWKSAAEKINTLRTGLTQEKNLQN